MEKEDPIPVIVCPSINFTMTRHWTLPFSCILWSLSFQMHISVGERGTVAFLPHDLYSYDLQGLWEFQNKTIGWMLLQLRKTKISNPPWRLVILFSVPFAVSLSPLCGVLMWLSYVHSFPPTRTLDPTIDGFPGGERVTKPVLNV